MLVATARRAFDHSLSFARTKAPAMAIQHVLNDTRWRKVSATEHTPAHEVFTAPIEQSVQDKRSYKLIRLENGLQAMLVHDKDADTSAASMDVAVGHLHDPDDMPGLAHFCEHMLFLGTKPFPKENAYNEYINASGGQTNAYTDASNTNYHFTVSSTKTPPSTPAPEAANGDVQVTAPTRKSPLPRALEMFAAFFHSPLFTSTGTNRELNAVDSEHKKNAQNDYWRIFQLNKGLSGHIVDKDGNVKKHPWHKFGTGSRATLSAYGRSVAHRQQKEQEKDKAATANGAANGNGHAVKDITCDPAHPLPALPSESEPDGGPVGIETRRRLVEWWEKEYCAGRMKLAVIGRESLDEQTQLVANLFSPIPNRNQEPWPLITESSFGPEQHGTMVEMKTVMDFRGFDIEWQIPWQSPFYLSKPADFLSHLVGHEGPGSLHSYLKQKGWITYLGAGVTAQGRGRSRFGVNGMLTKEGLENRAAFLDAVFKYVSLLRHSDLPSYLYEEQRQMGEIHFRFSEKQNADDYAIGIATGLNKPYAREHILSGRQRVWEYDEQGVRSLLDELVPSKARVMFCAREFPTMEEGVEEKEWEKETWYGTEYRVRKMPGGLLEAKKNDIGEMFLPRPNEFLPKRLEVNKMEVKEPLKAPTKIHDTPASILYHKKDDQFWVPRAVYYANIITPLGQVTPRNAVKTRMYTNLVNDALTEYSYDATLAGLHYRCYGTERGLFFSVGGYNDKIPVLAGTVLDKMRNIKINKARFEVLREELIQEYENFYLTDPYRYADYLINYLMSDMAWTPREKLAELKTLTPEEVQEHINQLLSRTYVEALAHGNITREEGESMLEMTEKVLASTELTPLERMHDRSLLLPEGANFVYQTSVPNLKEVNSALVYHCHVGLVSDRALISRNALLLHMMREPAFDDLRTKQQLGYIVFVTRAEGRSVFGIRFTIQSEREPVYLESRVEAFLESFRKQLGEMKEEEFEKQKEGLMAAKLQKLENLYSETNRFWSHISNGYLDFRRQEREVEVIRTLKLEDMTTFFDTYLAPTSPQRRKLSIHLRSQHVPKVPTPAKFSVAASEAHLALVQSHGIHVEVDTYRAYCKAEPPVAAVKAFWTGHFKTLPEVKEDVKKTLLDKVEELAREHADVPKEADEKATLRAGTKIIEDVRVFKAGLGLGPAAMPIEEV